MSPKVKIRKSWVTSPSEPLRVVAVVAAVALSLSACGGSGDAESAAPTTQSPPAGYVNAKTACDQVPAVKAEAQKLSDAGTAETSRAAATPEADYNENVGNPTPTMQAATQVMFDEITKAVAANPAAYTDLGNRIAEWKGDVSEGNGAATFVIGSVESSCQTAIPTFGFGSGSTTANEPVGTEHLGGDR